MRKFRVFAKNVKKYLDEIDTFDGFTIAVTSYGGIIAYDLKTKTWMQLDTEVYEVCYATYLADKYNKDLFEDDILFHEEHGCYYQIVRDNISQGFNLKEVYPHYGSTKNVNDVLNWLVDCERINNQHQVELYKEEE